MCDTQTKSEKSCCHDMAIPARKMCWKFMCLSVEIYFSHRFIFNIVWTSTFCNLNLILSIVTETSTSGYESPPLSYMHWPDCVSLHVSWENIDPSIESPKNATSQEEIAIGYECYSLQKIHVYIVKLFHDRTVEQAAITSDDAWCKASLPSWV